MESNLQQKLDTLTQSVKALALNPDKQIGIFPNFVSVADELALNFSDAVLFKDELKEAKILDSKQILLLREIDRILDIKSKNNDRSFWSLEGLKNHPEWQEIRMLATKTLDLLNVEDRTLKEVEGIVYIQDKKKT